MRRFVSDWDIEAMIRLAREGKGHDEIARVLGWRRQTVTAVLLAHGVRSRLPRETRAQRTVRMAGPAVSPRRHPPVLESSFVRPPSRDQLMSRRGILARSMD